ncbi:MAG: hypothetical protein JJU00_17545 [Opitutales bacterium]|nr:hypothetical protein [Opitutales bacterium]
MNTIELNSMDASTIARTAAAMAALVAGPILLVNTMPLLLRFDTLFSGKLWLVAGVFTLFAVFALHELRTPADPAKPAVRRIRAAAKSQWHPEKAVAGEPTRRSPRPQKPRSHAPAASSGNLAAATRPARAALA